jgi:hypothetical protein
MLTECLLVFRCVYPSRLLPLPPTSADDNVTVSSARSALPPSLLLLLLLILHRLSFEKLSSLSLCQACLLLPAHSRYSSLFTVAAG